MVDKLSVYRNLHKRLASAVQFLLFIAENVF